MCANQAALRCAAAAGDGCSVDGRFDLPTSEDEIKDFLDTLVHCYNDLYW
jgi:hypothetical protein